MDELRMLKTDLSESTYHWAISGLVRDGGLTRLGYDSYSLSSDLPKDEYVPVYSDTAERLIRLISEKYPYVQFTVFETVLMNEFLNHLIAQNTVFIQVEKESSIYVFRFLQDQGIQNVMYKPSKKDFNLYWAKDSVIVTDMISEAPIRMLRSSSLRKRPHRWRRKQTVHKSRPACPCRSRPGACTAASHRSCRRHSIP